MAALRDELAVIQAQLAECKAAAEATTDKATQKRLDGRKNKLFKALRRIKTQLAAVSADDVATAQACYEVGDFAAACTLFRRALDANPTTKNAADLPPLYQHADCCLRTGALSDALADCEILVRNWPHCAAAFYLRGRLHFEAGEQRAAVADLERALALLNARRTAAQSRAVVAGHAEAGVEVLPDFGDVRIWLHRAQTLGVGGRSLSSSSTAASSVAVALPPRLLRHIWTFCGFRELCRLESVCNAWHSLCLDYRRFLWRPVFSQVAQPHARIHAEAFGEAFGEAKSRCPKTLFAGSYRPWVDCANCGQRFDPLNNAEGCSENCYHPGAYGYFDAATPASRPGTGSTEYTGYTGWDCCRRADRIQRVCGARFYDTKRSTILNVPLDSIQQQRHDAWPRHLGDRAYVSLPCSRGCRKGPHSERPGHLLVDTKAHDPLERSGGSIGPTVWFCNTCHDSSAAPPHRRRECWQDFLDHYAQVRQFIRCGRFRGIQWWEKGT